MKMKYTGRKDKNGKKIYEGNIVKGNNGIEIISYNEVEGIFYCGDDTMNKHHDLELIGNIFENPEIISEELIRLVKNKRDDFCGELKEFNFNPTKMKEYLETKRMINAPREFNLRNERKKLFKHFMGEKGYLNFHNGTQLWDITTQKEIMKLIEDQDKEFIEICLAEGWDKQFGNPENKDFNAGIQFMKKRMIKIAGENLI